MVLLAMGFKKSTLNSSLFIKFTSQSIIYLLVYVDDIIITSSNDEKVKSLIVSLHSKLTLTWVSSVTFWA